MMLTTHHTSLAFNRFYGYLFVATLKHGMNDCPMSSKNVERGQISGVQELLAISPYRYVDHPSLVYYRYRWLYYKAGATVSEFMTACLRHLSEYLITKHGSGKAVSLDIARPKKHHIKLTDTDLPSLPYGEGGSHIPILIQKIWYLTMHPKMHLF